MAENLSPILAQCENRVRLTYAAFSQVSLTPRAGVQPAISQRYCRLRDGNDQFIPLGRDCGQSLCPLSYSSHG